jgi:ubiquinone/menaquinone biosynthesis C-methylase UbiE
MRWQLRCLIDNCKGIVPFHNEVRALKRRIIPYKSCLPRNVYAIDEGMIQIKWLCETIGTLEGKVVLEIGSGWEPLIPLLFSLCRVRRVYLTDLTPLLDKGTVLGALDSFRSNKKRILEKLNIAPLDFEQMLCSQASSVGDFLEAHRFTYLAPCDCRHLALKPSTLDIVTSRSVFEHIPPPVIDGILKETYRLLKPGGMMCHFIDNSDHWEHGDKRISRLNFLRFTDNAFRWTCLNSLHYQNRLRHNEYVEMLQKRGFEIVRARRNIDARSVEALATLHVAPRFRRFSAEELATVDSYLLARKPLT